MSNPTSRRRARSSGLWITPDFSLRADVENASEQQRRFRAVVAQATGRAMYDNAFSSQEQLRAFLGGLGLHPRVLDQVDQVPDITSLNRLHLPRHILDDAKPALKLWISTVPGRR